MNCTIPNIDELPSIAELEKTSKGLALVDAILMPEWEYRYFSFNSQWDVEGKEMMASMRDGSGNEYFILFTENGVVGKVLFGSSKSNVSSYLKDIPDSFSTFKHEDAFNLKNASLFFWREIKDNHWSALPKGLSVYPLLGFLTCGSKGYKKWAEDYYEKKVDPVVLSDVFTQLTANADQVAILNSDITIEELRDDIREIVG